MKVVILLIFVSSLESIYCSLAPFIKPCHASDVACLKSSAQQALPVLAEGIPSLGINPLDPLHIDRIKTNQAGLTLDFKNTVITGLKNCLVMDLKRFEHSTVLKTKCSVSLVGDYSLRGQLLMLPIEGDGPYKIVIHNFIVNVHFNAGERVVGGEKFWTVDSWTHTFEMPTGVRYLFKNLFNGDRKLSDPIQKYTNENWQDVFRDVAPPVVKAIVARVVEDTTKLFDKVPITQLELD